MIEQGERIPAPTDANERTAWERDLAILDADPRTAGGSNRPTWLVERVLDDAFTSEPITAVIPRETLAECAAQHRANLAQKGLVK